MRDKIVLVTGANSGIGKITALNLARKGATVVLVCRSRDKGELAQYEIINLTENQNVHLLQADLSLKSEVMKLVESFKNIFPRLDVLVNNAGMLGTPRRTETKEGFETTIATNYFSQFLTSVFFVDWLEKSEDPRIINVTSYTHRLTTIDWKDIMMKYTYKPFLAYGKSKLMATMFSYELAERLRSKKIAVNVAEPRTVYTNIAQGYPRLFRILYQLGEPFMDTPEKGAETLIYLATEKKIRGVTQQLFKGREIRKMSKWCRDAEARKRLWKETFHLLQLKEEELRLF